jgi:septal ring factor EnvC (AmiA/AmiB activator)
LAFIGCLLALTGCDGTPKEKAELQNKLAATEIALSETGNENDALRTKVTNLSEAVAAADGELSNVVQDRDNLRQQMKELAQVRQQLRGLAGQPFLRQPTVPSFS